MHTISKLSTALSLSSIALASCAFAQSGDSEGMSPQEAGVSVEDKGTFERPWAIEFLPGTETLAITEKAGTLK
ncbi:MAG: PQQ-dependent sugar dehydrogenase, partial [Pseudomonadota bacterium]